MFISQFSADMEDFISYRCSLGYNRSTYECPLKKLDRFIAENFPNEEFLSKTVVMKWIEQFPTDGNARIVRLFAEYLVNTGSEAFIIAPNFIGGKPRYVPHILTDSELNNLFRCIDKRSQDLIKYPIKGMYSVLFRLIYTCGLRPKEGRTLKRKNVSISTGEIHITNTKRHKERTVVMSDDMNTYMQQYLSVLDISHKDNAYLFPYGDSCVSVHQVRNFFESCWRDANSDVDISKIPKLRVYDLRHRFATENIMRWTEQKKNIQELLPYLKAYMGHKHWSDTEYYVHLLPERISAYAEAQWNELTKLVPEVQQ